MNTVTTHQINFDQEPKMYGGRRVRLERQLPNRVRGLVEFDPKKIELYTDSEQYSAGGIRGYELCKKLAIVPVFGTQLLDFLLVNTSYISTVFPGLDWDKVSIPFWGTIIDDPEWGPCVECLYRSTNGHREAAGGFDVWVYPWLKQLLPIGRVWRTDFPIPIHKQ